MHLRKKRFLVIVFCCIIFSIRTITSEEKKSTSIEQKEEENLKEALKCLNMSLEDLNFEKKYVKDEYRLRLVDELLDEPMKTPKTADEFDYAVTKNIGKPSSLIHFFAEKLDTKISNATDFSKTKISLLEESKRLFKNEKGIIDIKELDNLDESLKKILAKIIFAFNNLNEDFEQAFKELSWKEKEDIVLAIQKMLINEKTSYEFFNIYNGASRMASLDENVILDLSKKVDFGKLYSASLNFRKICDEIIQDLKEFKGSIKNFSSEEKKKEFGVSGDVILCLQTKYGGIIIGGSGWNVYTKNQFIIIDLGGDDVYRFEKGDTAIRSFDLVNCSILFDCSGNDYYESRSGFNFGAGILGMGVNIDLSGDDVYKSGNFTLGCGFFGVGIFEDFEGDDIYKSDAITQGAGLFGIGLMIDRKGNDKYYANLFSQGFGFIKGFGGLLDETGNDLYYAGGKYPHAPLLPEQFQSLSQGFGFGMRYSNASGGIGFLWDKSGNDYYEADVYGQGASYWFSLGLLVDNAGHDNYTLTQYGQGAGIHLSIGILVDRGGFDHYFCRNGVAQGCGHDLAVGFLLDKSGDDYYQGSGLTQGASNANGIGILIDSSGNDGYSGVRDEIQGFSFTSRNTIGIGVLIDLSGNDNYSKGHKDNSYWIKGTYGIGVDK